MIGRVYLRDSKAAGGISTGHPRRKAWVVASLFEAPAEIVLFVYIEAARRRKRRKRREISSGRPYLPVEAEVLFPE
jgi:hypothetical protein